MIDIFTTTDLATHSQALDKPDKFNQHHNSLVEDLLAKYPVINEKIIMEIVLNQII